MEQELRFGLDLGRLAVLKRKRVWVRFMSSSSSSLQSHYREVPRWEIFMEQELRFGLDLGRMANFPAFIASKSFDL